MGPYFMSHGSINVRPMKNGNPQEFKQPMLLTLGMWVPTLSKAKFEFSNPDKFSASFFPFYTNK